MMDDDDDMSYVMMKPVYTNSKQQRHRSTCTSTKSDQRLYYSLYRQYNSCRLYTQKYWCRPVWILPHTIPQKTVVLIWCDSHENDIWTRNMIQRYELWYMVCEIYIMLKECLCEKLIQVLSFLPIIQQNLSLPIGIPSIKTASHEN